MKTEQQQLQRMISRSMLPQVMLLHGTDREQGKALLKWLLQCIFCPSACGNCASCQQVAADKHTDVLYFTGGKEEGREKNREKSKSKDKGAEKEKFGVSEASRLQEFMQIRSYASARVAVIFDAHLMTKQAANKLLKTLEEPDGHVLLFSNRKATLLPTIRSRCFHFLITSTAEISVPYRNDVQAILTTTSMSKATAAAKALKDKGCSVDEFLQALEVHLHSAYKDQTLHQSTHVRERRRHLHSLKRLVRQQTTLNLQMCVESLLVAKR